ncbi:MAG: hypothetical protein ACKVOK_14485 [Flavobacteriales bacterium]
MKRIYYIAFVLTFGVIASCKKEVDTDNFPYETASYQNEVAAIYDDANSLMTFFTEATPDTPCGIVEILDSADLFKKTFVFSGLSCNGKLNRSGRIHLQLQNASDWYTTGAELKITFENFALTTIAGSGESLVINGSRMVTNLSGATLLEELTPGGPGIQRQFTAQNMSITYPNGTQRIWNESQLMTSFKNPDWEFEFLLEGNATGLPYSNIGNWGVDRKGENYYTEFNEALTAKLCGGIWKQSGGKTTIYHTESPATMIEFGVDSEGNPSSEACFAYGINVIWTDEEGIVHVTTRPYF